MCGVMEYIDERWSRGLEKSFFSFCKFRFLKCERWLLFSASLCFDTFYY